MAFDFSAGSAGNFFDAAHLHGELVAGEGGGAEFAELTDGWWGLAFGDHDFGEGEGAEGGVVFGEDAGFCDGGVAVECFFNLLGEDLHPGDVDDAFAAASHGNGAVLNLNKITGGEPFVFTGLPGDEVGIEHAGAFEVKFSVVLFRFVVGEGLAEGGGLFTGLGEVEDGEADFDNAKGLGEGELETFFERTCDFRIEGGSGGDSEAELGERAGFGALGELGEVEGATVEELRAAFFGGLVDGLGVV